MFASVAYIPLADATAISFLNPVFGMILAIPLLGERVGKWRWLAAAIALRRQEAVFRMQPGYDHSYFFVASFMADHVAFHADALFP
ncbi:MAG: EamA family transporter, partial [Pseudomonadota bacterium]